MIQIYSPISSNRLSYTLAYIFGHIFKIDYQLICLKEELDNGIAVINYSNEPVHGIQIKPCGLLTEKGIKKCEPLLGRCDGVPFPILNIDEPESFDLFGSVFFMISRYEEYYHPQTDLHGRPFPEKTWLGRNQLLDTPIVDLWLNKFGEQLEKEFGVEVYKFGFSCLSTIDIDNGYRYKLKGLKRFIGGSIKDVQRGAFSNLNNRWATYYGFRRDDFDIYDWLINLHKSNGIPLHFFILNAKKGSHDHGLPRNGKGIKQLVNLFIKNQVPFGIHPSYSSNRHEIRLSKEIEGLSQLAGFAIQSARQHYLKLDLKKTYNNLIKFGIKEDYTMGFASNTGFRAGTSRSFFYYDLVEEQETQLLLHPLTVMEGAYKDYLNIHSFNANPPINHLINAVRNVGGTFISIWHEAQLAEKSNWRKVYLQMMNDLSN